MDDLWRRTIGKVPAGNARVLAEVSELFVKAILAMDEIEKSGGSPYMKAFQNLCLHIVNGGTMEAFRALLRTSDYAGFDRRKKTNGEGVYH